MLAASFDPAGLQIMAVGVDGKFRWYSCEVCARIPGLLRRAATLSRVHDSVSRA